MNDDTSRSAPDVERTHAEPLLREAQEQLRASQRALRQAADTQAAILDALPAHVALLDPDGVILAVNQAWRGVATANALHGPDVCVGTNYLDVCLHARGECAEQAKAAAIGIRRVLRGEAQAFAIEYPCRSLTQPRWFELTVARLPGDRRAGAMVMHVEITGRKQADEAAQRSQQRLRDVLDGLGPSIFVGLMTPQGALIEANRPALAAAGLTPEDVLGKPFEETHWWAYSPDVQQQLRTAIERAASGSGSRYDVQIRGANDDLIDVDFSLQPLRDEAGEVVFLVPSATVITERKQTENALRESNQKFHLLADHITDAFWIRSPDMREVHYLSPGFERIWGRSVESLQAQPHQWLDFIMPEDRAHVLGVFAGLTRDAPSVDIEYRIVRPDGEVRWIRARGFQVRDATGQLTRLTGIVTDITERQRVAAALQESEERYRALVDWSHEPIAVSRRGTILFVNPAAVKMLGATSEEQLIGTQILDRVHPDFHQVVRERLNNLEPGGVLPMIEERLITLDGTVIDVEIQGTTIVYDQDLATFSSMHDVTESKRAAEALRTSTEEFRLLAEAMPQIVWITRPDGSNVYFNQYWMDYTGLTAEESYGSGWNKPFHPDDQERAWRAWQHATATIGTYTLECRLCRADGVYRWWLIRGVPLRDTAGNVLKWFGTCTDIHDLKLAELEIVRTNLALHVEIVERKRAEDAAGAANRSKSEFLANMSHEIRTPLNGVVGMTELALGTDLSAEQRAYLDMAKASGALLLTLINDILDFSKIEAGQLTLEVIPFDLSECLDKTLKLLAAGAGLKGLELACDIRPHVPTALMGDPGRLRQIVMNLVGNAIKFTERGEVVLTVETQSRTDRDAVLRFSVSDTGVGVPREHQAVIFKPFIQADGSTTRRYGGTGLGLAISTSLVALLGGRIWLESEPGKGSTFHFTASFDLQQAAAFHTKVRDPQIVRLRDVPILVVDDNAVNRRILEATLRQWGMKPVLAASGPAGLAAMQERKIAGTHFPLVLLDAQMPGMDGYAVAEEVRKDPELAGTALVMLTSTGQPADAARGRSLRIAGALMKPISQSELREAISAALGMPSDGTRQLHGITRRSAHESRRTLRILLAEDNKVNQVVAARLLGKQGHTVVIAGNGLEALAALDEPGAAFDLILMDVQMPEMDGFEATRIIRAREQSSGAHLPIIAMTAHAMKGDEERCLAAGMNGYASKPIDIEHLLLTIDRVLS
ncbi:MAG: PAS domain S-box protein [Acidobacteriota bacterium]